MKIITKILYCLLLILIVIPWLFILFEKQFAEVFVNRIQVFSNLSEWYTFVDYVAIAMSLIVLVLLMVVIFWPRHKTRYELFNENRQKLSVTEKSIQHLIQTALRQSNIYEPNVGVKIRKQKIVVHANGYTTNDKDLTLQAELLKQLVNEKVHTLIGESKIILDVDIDLDTDKNARARVL